MQDKKVPKRQFEIHAARIHQQLIFFQFLVNFPFDDYLTPIDSFFRVCVKKPLSKITNAVNYNDTPW